MMRHTLNPKQFQQLEAFLKKQYGLQVDDQVRFEILDHMACDIEEKLNQGASYAEAFRVTLSKWHHSLQPSRFNGYGKIPRFIAKRLIRLDLAFQLSVILALVIVLALLETPSLTWVYSGFVLLLSSFVISLWSRRQALSSKSFSSIYYGTQTLYLNVLNGVFLVAMGIWIVWSWNTPVMRYSLLAFWFPSWLLVAYNTYFSYRLYQVKQSTKTSNYV